MSKRIFTTADIKELSKNKNVSKCSDKSITYSKHFKVLAVKKYYEEGYSPSMIFNEAGFDVKLIGKDVPSDCLHRWKKIYNNKGKDALNIETRGLSSAGRLRRKWNSEAEKIEYLEIEIAYLKAENDFLVKLRAAKKR
jgi:hypothetical protein